MRRRGRERQPVSIDQRRLTELSRAQALRLLGSVALGRIVFTQRAMPAIRPVNHVLDAGHIIIRSHSGTAVVSEADTARGVVVAYEADDIDPVTHLGWSVVVTGTAHLVTDPGEMVRYQHLITPWVDGEMDQVIRIRPAIITGFRLGGARDSDFRP
jgi:nitroimidazol reductase NimA-like FMN-containing flavoprotein (pyridoxamine 5'-phosphate oxidase superfamily)